MVPRIRRPRRYEANDTLDRRDDTRRRTSLQSIGSDDDASVEDFVVRFNGQILKQSETTRIHRQGRPKGNFRRLLAAWFGSATTALPHRDSLDIVLDKIKSGEATYRPRDEHTLLLWTDDSVQCLSSAIIVHDKAKLGDGTLHESCTPRPKVKSGEEEFPQQTCGIPQPMLKAFQSPVA